ncbi:CoA-transferase [Magnetospirillum fulvum]|uniref:CoA transferase, subunit B n=1 Tax=Magnetospirillum fulvum MGU-K5 TaxID=1316936 RepID=S9SDF7_MAGFU|nr:CoA-transferase [Magnetospirillum fulvum]EPY02083.1 CoA transferase, subunit B [Magnetospirillum fulvum MGU-K5]
MTGRFSSAEFLAATLARLLAGSRTVAVGTSSPIPAAAALLANLASRQPMTVSLLGSSRTNPFTSGGVELFDFAAQGRLDSFVLGGGQIDGAGNVNLVGIGGYPTSRVRFPGCYGSAYLASLVPNLVLFREEHSHRVLVPQVDFISAAGRGPDGTYRPGGPTHLLTGRALFRFDRDRGGFTLLSVHPGETVASVREQTGFAFDTDPSVGETPPPDAAALVLLRGPVAAGLTELYPAFTQRLLKTV